MNDQAREALNQVIRTYGSAICNTPRSCEMFIRQACGAYPNESRALIEALRLGVTNELMSYQPAEHPWEEFSGQLTKQLRRSGLNEVEGGWAVETWARVLNRHPENYVAPPPPKPVLHDTDKPRPIDKGVKAAMTLIVGLGGGLGGLFGSIMVPAAVLITSAATDMPLYKSLNFKPSDIWLAVTVIVLILGFFGFVGGAIGGAVGWLFGRGEQGHWNAFCTAFGGGFVSAALGGYFVGIIGSTIGSLIGAFGAAMTTASRGGMA